MTQDATGGEIKAPRAPLFVWWSSEESVRNGIPSALAAFEVVVAVTAYWAIAIYFKTFTHLWASICVAPLLLLRSDQSTALGARWFEAYLATIAHSSRVGILARGSINLWLGLFVFVVTSAIAFIILSYQWLIDYADWAFIWREIVVATVALQLGTAAVTAAGAYNVLMTTIASGLFGRHARLALVATTPGLFLGIWIRSVCIRFAATIFYLWKGFSEVPKNFRHTLFTVDLRHPAEVMPGYKGTNSIFSSSAFFKLMRSSSFSWEQFLAAILFLILFVPAYAYRLSIKSTCWVYLPLVYIASERDFVFSLSHLLDRLERSPWERLRRILAIGAFGATATVVLIYNFTKLPEILAVKLISPFEYLFLLDLPWKKPWQFFNLLSACITVYLWVEAGQVRIDQQHAHQVYAQALLGTKFKWLKLWMRLRNVSSALLILILAIHTLLIFSPIAAYLPIYILHGLSWVYGNYMPAAP